jgi:membrane protein involved in D-alanine export
MIPYTDFLYFSIAFYILTLPSFLVGLLKKFSRAWILLATAIMLAVQYSSLSVSWMRGSIQEIWLVLGFALTQWIISFVFLGLRKRVKNKWIFYLAILFGLLPMLVVKFVPLFDPSFGLGFLGISYVTFRSLDVLISIQDGLIQSLPPQQYLAFLLFFPALSSGPIDRWRRFEQDWKHDRTRAEFFQDLDTSIHHIFTGFLYKFILAVLIKRYWLDPMTTGVQFWHIVSYMYAYSLYLFFDFAGYSAFAVGFSHLMGIHTPENFDRPFLARNIRDFWNRWHISLSWWFRDHVYSRFVFAATKGHWFKNRYVASYLGFLLSMGLMGLWHGTAWYYLLYGLYHGALLVAHDFLSRWNKQHKILPTTGLFSEFGSIFITINFVCFGLLLFSGRLA